MFGTSAYPMLLSSTPSSTWMRSCATSLRYLACAVAGSWRSLRLAKAWHDFAREQLHRAADLVLGQAAEIHPAEDLADADRAHVLDVARDGVGRAEGQRLRHEPVPRDRAEPLRHRAERRLERGVRVLDALGNHE